MLCNSDGPLIEDPKLCWVVATVGATPVQCGNHRWHVGPCWFQVPRVWKTVEEERREDLFALVGKELDRAYGKHGRAQWSRHEFYGILLEEVEELWDNIKTDKVQALVDEELLHVAAMCFRYFETRDRLREPRDG